MKKFILRIILLFAILAIFDFAFGHVMDTIVNRIAGGGQGRDNYICNKASEDILIFGSSRAVHHYNAQMLEDSLGMSCYNCGDDGNGIILSYGRLKMIESRKTPKIIIQDIAVTFDLLNNDNHTYLGWLKSRYDREGIKEIFEDIDQTEKYKMQSYLYRYNSKFLQNVFVYLTSFSTDTGVKGFRPLNGGLDPMKVNRNRVITTNNQYDFDPLKLDFVNKFVDLCGDAKLLFVVSPIWYGSDTAQYQPIKEICREHAIPFLDYSNHPKYLHNDEFFKDGTHLNARGADEFTRDMIVELRKLGF